MIWTIILALLFTFVVLPTLCMVVILGFEALANPLDPDLKWFVGGWFVAAVFAAYLVLP